MMDGRLELLTDAIVEPFLAGSTKNLMLLPPNSTNSHFLHFHRSGGKIESKVEFGAAGEAVGRPIKKIAKAIYGGVLFNNFGHFVAESLGRLWPLILNEVPATLPILFHPCTGPQKKMQIAAYVRDTFQFLGLDVDQIILIEHPIEIGQLVVPVQGKILGNAPTLLDYYSIFDRCGSRSRERPVWKNVYVSRSKFLATGSFLGETVFEQRLASSGVKIHYPEKSSVEESIQIYRAAQNLIFSEGSAIHLLEIAGKTSADVTIVARRNTDFVNRIFADPLKTACKRVDVFPASSQITPLHWNKTKSAPTISMAGAIVDLNALIEHVAQKTELKIPPMTSAEIEEAMMLDLGKMLFSGAIAENDDERLGYLFRRLHSEIREALSRL